MCSRSGVQKIIAQTDKRNNIWVKIICNDMSLSKYEGLICLIPYDAIGWYTYLLMLPPH